MAEQRWAAGHSLRRVLRSLKHTQHGFIAAGLLLVFVTGLFPPMTRVVVRSGNNLYHPDGRAFLFYLGTSWVHYTDYHGYRRIDYRRLHTEWLMIAVGIGALAIAAKARRLPGNGRHKGGTTLGGDLIDLAIMVGARAARLGVQEAKAVGAMVSKVAAELGRALTPDEHKSVTETATKLAGQTPEQFAKTTDALRARI